MDSDVESPGSSPHKLRPVRRANRGRHGRFQRPARRRVCGARRARELDESSNDGRGKPLFSSRSPPQKNGRCGQSRVPCCSVPCSVPSLLSVYDDRSIEMNAPTSSTMRGARSNPFNHLFSKGPVTTDMVRAGHTFGSRVPRSDAREEHLGAGPALEQRTGGWGRWRWWMQ